MALTLGGILRWHRIVGKSKISRFVSVVATVLVLSGCGAQQAIRQARAAVDQACWYASDELIEFGISGAQDHRRLGMTYLEQLQLNADACGWDTLCRECFDAIAAYAYAR